MTRNAERRRITALRLDSVESIISARVASLRPLLDPVPHRRIGALTRLLRSERRAAFRGAGYDAARHAAICRLIEETRRLIANDQRPAHLSTRRPG